MNLSSFFVLSSLVLCASPAVVAQSSVTVEHCDFGERYQFEVFDCSLNLKNAGDKRVRISKISAADLEDGVSPVQVVVGAGQTVKLKMRVSLRSASGTISRMVNFETDEVGSPYQWAYAYGFVNSILKDPKPSIDFGRVKLSDALPEKQVTLESIESREFRITGIVKSPDYVDASLAPDGRTVKVRIKRNIAWGTHDDDQIVVSLNSTVQKNAAIALRVVAIGEVLASEDPAALGVIRNDKPNDHFIELNSLSGRAFKTGKVTLEGVSGDADVVDCSPAKKGCQRVRLRIGSGLAVGPIQGVVNVDIPDSKQKLPIRFSGMVLPPGLDPAVEEKDTETKPVAGTVPPKSAPADIRNAIRSQVRDANIPAPAGTGPLLKWSVADEAAVYGYYVLRADQQSGPFEKINAETIKAEEFEAGLVNSYQWRDTSAEIGKVYWYSVGTLYRDGRKEPLTSAQMVVAKP